MSTQGHLFAPPDRVEKAAPLNPVKKELARRANNKDRVLEFLKQRGPKGAENLELVRIGGLRYGARIFELRKEGYVIETIPGEDGAFTFVFRGRKEGYGTTNV